MRAALLQGEATLSAYELFLAVAQLPEAFSDEVCACQGGGRQDETAEDEFRDHRGLVPPRGRAI